MGAVNMKMVMLGQTRLTHQNDCIFRFKGLHVLIFEHNYPPQYLRSFDIKSTKYCKFIYVLDLGNTGFIIPVAHVILYNSTIELRKVRILCNFFIHFLIIRFYLETKGFLHLLVCQNFYPFIVQQHLLSLLRFLCF